MTETDPAGPETAPLSEVKAALERLSDMNSMTSRTT
jgi:hypothetical protein